MEVTVNLQGKKAVINLTKEQIAEINKQQDPYLQACLKMGETPRPPLTGINNSRLIHEDFAHRLEMCIEAKNAIEQPDGSLKRWIPVYGQGENHFVPYLKPDLSGSGWAYDDYDSWDTVTCVGPRREYRTHSLMMEGVEEFKEYYEGCYNN